MARRFGSKASYNPIFDLNKNVVKIVKFATDITDLTHIGEGLTRLAAGNLDHSIKEPFTPAFAKLRTDFNSAHANLQSTLVRIAEGANTIQAGTQEISSASDDLSRRTEQQAASLEETAAALDEITATVKKTSEGTLHCPDGGGKHQIRCRACGANRRSGGGGHEHHREIITRDWPDHRGN